MLKKIFIDNYKTFDNFEMQFSDIVLMLGKNGVGKSSLLKALVSIRDFSTCGIITEKDADGNEVPRFGGDTITRWNEKRIQTFELYVDISGCPYVFRLKFDMYGQPLKVRTVCEEIVCDGVTIFKFENGLVHLFNDKTFKEMVQYPFDWYKSALATIYSRPENQKVMIFKQWLENITSTQVNPWCMKGSAHVETSSLNTDASNFSSWYRYLRQNSDISVVGDYTREMQKLIPELRDLVIRGEGVIDRELVIRPNEAESAEKRNYIFRLSDLSDGQRALLALYAILHFQIAKDRLVCLDEPDNFLSIDEVQPFLRVLVEKIEDEGAQVVITSHNSEVLNYLAESNGIEFTREDGLQTRVRQFKNEYEKLTPSETMSRGWN